LFCNIACLHLTRTGLKRVWANKKTESISLDSCYTEDFVNRLNDHDFVGVSDYSNEIFLYHYIRLMEYCEFLKNSESSRYDTFCRLVDKVFFLKSRLIIRQKVFFLSRLISLLLAFFGFIFSVFLIFIFSIVLPFYFFIRKGNVSPCERKSLIKNIFFIRSRAAYQKCRVKIETTDCGITFFDDCSGLKVPGVSIYSVISWKNIFSLTMKAAYYGLRDIKVLFCDGRKMLGVTCTLAIFPGYVKKIAHKAVYESCFNEIVNEFPAAVFFTGDKDDRFALLQTRICKREKRKIVCLPHGLEYGFRFPGGLAGTTFYCFTSEAAKFLNDLYKEIKFVYSKAVVDEMYGLDSEEMKYNQFSRVCFFTEPRDPEVNYKIIEKLRERSVIFAIKLHPLESSENYRKKFPEIEQIEDFNDAIDSMTCLARKSTVLLEASRRGAKSIAVLVNEKDCVYVMKLFPSLCSNNICRAFTFDELLELL